MVTTYGFAPLPPAADLGVPERYGNTIPATAIIKALPDHNATATWSQHGVQGDQACVAMRHYGQQVPGITELRYRRKTFIAACSSTLSEQAIVSWLSDAIPGLSGTME